MRLEVCDPVLGSIRVQRGTCNLAVTWSHRDRGHTRPVEVAGFEGVPKFANTAREAGSLTSPFFDDYEL